MSGFSFKYRRKGTTGKMLAYDTAQWRALVNTIMNPQVS
jgi:hypothetical protein